MNHDKNTAYHVLVGEANILHIMCLLGGFIYSTLLEKIVSSIALIKMFYMGGEIYSKKERCRHGHAKDNTATDIMQL